MKQLIRLFKIRKEERWTAITALFLFIMLNSLTIIKYQSQFARLCGNYHRLFVRTFHVSGFDPLTYSVISDWDTEYNVYRHPLLAFFMFIPNQINQGMMVLTGHNMVQYVTAFFLILSAFYSFIFLLRIFTDVIGLKRFDAILLTFSFFGFAYVMVSTMVPDHFVFSMTLLVFTLYICGLKIKKRIKLNGTETVLLFALTAGISLNNGLKTFFAALFTNGKSFFKVKYLIAAVVIPSALIWLFARYEYRTFVWPKEMARKVAKQKKNELADKKLYLKYADTCKVKDSATVKAGVDKIIAKRSKNKRWEKNSGKPLGTGEFSRWTDISTARIPSIIENFFGESMILHKKYLLGDTLKSRPLIVHYRWISNYVVEGLTVLLFLMGIICGRKSRFLWMAMSFFALDVVLHIVFGFGINEVYIMAAHWIYVVPIAMGFLFVSLRSFSRNFLFAVRTLVILLTAYMWVYNGFLLTKYMIG